MEFASPYAYVARDEEVVEQVEESDLRTPVSALLSDAPAPAAAPRAKKAKRHHNVRRFVAAAPRQQQEQEQQQQQQPQQQAAGGGGLVAGLRSLFGSSAPAAPPAANKVDEEAEAASSASEEDDDAAAAAPAEAAPAQGRLRPAAPPRPPRPPIRGGRVVQARADTNVLALKFGTLALDAPDIFAGDPITCKGCGAALSFLSKPRPRAAAAEGKEAPGGAVWACEFCETENEVNVAPEEVPSGDTRDYVVEPAPADAGAEAKGRGAGEGAIIFCVDTSGSMCVTREVAGDLKLKTQARRRAAARDDFFLPEEQGFQNAPVAKSNTTWVSRLECVQAAVDDQLQAMLRDKAQRPVGLVTFSGDVCIYGDAAREPEVVAGAKLSDEQQLQAIGSRWAPARPVAESGKALSDRLFALSESGPTALGPALTVALSMAAAAKRVGSRVILCTDGLANVGVGSLDARGADAAARTQQWYEGMGNFAKLSGVVVDVISIRGEECALEALGRLAETTGGSVTRVDPLELGKNFTSILERPVLATQVSATMMVHRLMRLVNDGEAPTVKAVRELGSVTDDTETTFQYGLAAPDALDKVQGLERLPFQVQIRFTRPSGMRCLRVITKAQPVTRKREEAERDVRVELLAAHVAQKGARLMEEGEFDALRAYNVANARLMKRSAQTPAQRYAAQQWSAFSNDVMESVAAQEQRSPAPQPPAAAAAAAAAGLLAPPAPPQDARARKAVASASRSDADYEVQHKMKFMSSNKFK